MGAICGRAAQIKSDTASGDDKEEPLKPRKYKSLAERRNTPANIGAEAEAVLEARRKMLESFQVRQ